MEYLPSMILWVVIIGAIVYKAVIQKNKNRKAAESGEDKLRVKQAAEQLLREPEGFQFAYAHWEEHSSYGRTVKITYHRHAVVFRNETLCVVPLYIDKKTREIQPGKPMVFTPENLGKVTVKAKEKDGAAQHVELCLGDKEGHVMLELYVDAENLRKNRWYPVNIMQQEECAAFERFVKALAQRVAGENPGVDALIEAESNAGLGIIGASISAIGAFLGLFLPPLGIVVSLAGMVLSIVSKLRGAKGKKCLIISTLCMAWSVFFCWMYYTYFFI